MKKIPLILAILAFCFNAYALDTGDLNVKGDTTLSKLTTNGFLKTSGGGGAVSVDTSAYLNSDQTAPQTTVGTFTFPIVNFGATTGVSATAAAGVLTLTGLAGTAENLMADFSQANTVILSTSTGVLSVNFSALNLITTGTFGAGAITGTSFTIGANTLTTTEWAFLDDQDQAVKTTSSPSFVAETLSGNLTFKSTVVATGHKEGVTINVSTESNLTSAALAYGFIRRTQDSPSDIYVSLANGVKGQMVTMQLTAKAAGNYVITDDYVGPGIVTKTGWDDITFDTINDSITLLYMDDTIGWIIVGNNGCTITN